MTHRTLALITGWSLVFMAIIGGFSLGYAFPQFFNAGPSSALINKFSDQQTLYQLMVVGIGITLILDVVVSYTLYKYFEASSKKLSLVVGILRAIYTLVFAIAAVSLAQNWTLTNISAEMLFTNLHSFRTIWYAGLVIFGGHVLLLGVLMKMYRVIPTILWVITIIAGFSYIIIHVLRLSAFDPALVSVLEMILSLPMILGELGLAIWLLIKGGKQYNKDS